VGILYEHGKPFYVPEVESVDPRQVACGSNKDNVKCYFEGNSKGAHDYENVFVPNLLNKIIIDFSQAQVSFDKPIDVYIPMRTDLAAPTVLSVSSSFKWNLVALDSTYKQTDFVELALALVKPTGGSTAPVASTVPLVIDVDTTDDAADPLLVG